MENCLARKETEDLTEYDNAENYLTKKSEININQMERRFEKLQSEIDAILTKWHKYKNKYYGGTEK